MSSKVAAALLPSAVQPMLPWARCAQRSIELPDGALQKCVQATHAAANGDATLEDRCSGALGPRRRCLGWPWAMLSPARIDSLTHNLNVMQHATTDHLSRLHRVRCKATRAAANGDATLEDR